MDQQQRSSSSPPSSNETTSLLVNGSSNGTSNFDHHNTFNETPTKSSDNRITAQQLYFPLVNPSVQGYYRFTATKLTPFAVLHTQPEDGPFHRPTHSHSSPTRNQNENLTRHDGGNNVTGLLRRSAVLPSHGIDPSGRWVLVSVGGRSGWAKRELLTPMSIVGEEEPRTASSSIAADVPAASAALASQANPSSIPKGTFRPAPTFRASEGWMGNHVFLCKGRVMLGSDAPLFFVSNALIIGFFLLHFCVLLPHLYEVDMVALESKDDGETLDDLHSMNSTTPPLDDSFATTYLSWTTHSITVWMTTILAFVSLGLLWITAMMDPGILPAISSPVRTPVPEGDSITIGGALGYKYCSTCNIFRPPRSKHCNSCNVCVSKFDQ